MSFFDQLGTLLSKYDVVGAFMTNIQLTFWAALGSFVLGTVLALMRIQPVPSLRWVGHRLCAVLSVILRSPS